MVLEGLLVSSFFETLDPCRSSRRMKRDLNIAVQSLKKHIATNITIRTEWENRIEHIRNIIYTSSAIELYFGKKEFRPQSHISFLTKVCYLITCPRWTLYLQLIFSRKEMMKSILQTAILSSPLEALSSLKYKFFWLVQHLSKHWWGNFKRT